MVSFIRKDYRSYFIYVCLQATDIDKLTSLTFVYMMQYIYTVNPGMVPLSEWIRMLDLWQ